MRGWTGGEPPLDPPDSDLPLVTCPDCEGGGEVEDALLRDLGRPPLVTCSRCAGDGEAYLTDEEVADARAEAEIDRAEARRDDY